MEMEEKLVVLRGKGRGRSRWEDCMVVKGQQKGALVVMDVLFLTVPLQWCSCDAVLLFCKMLPGG